MTKHFIVAVILALSASTAILSQGTVLIVADVSCILSIDGEASIEIEKGTPKKISLGVGEHFIHAKSKGEIIQERTEIISVEQGKQKILKLSFYDALNSSNQIHSKKENASGNQPPTVLVAELNLSLSGTVNYLADENSILSTDLPYAFDKGDQVSFNIDIQNKKGKFNIQLYSYPGWNLVYSSQRLENLEDHAVTISQRGIYVVRLSTGSLFDRMVKLTIRRKPASQESVDFNTTVTKKTHYKSIKVLEPSNHYLNSTSHEYWKGGNNEVVIPITVPAEAEQWYYTVYASRNKDEIESGMKSFSLLSDLGKALGGIEPSTAALGIVLDLASQPPGSNYCNVFLLDYANQSLFKADQAHSYILEGSRENTKSSTIAVKCCMGEQYYLGIENTDRMHGIHVGLEAVAIIKEEYLEYGQ